MLLGLTNTQNHHGMRTANADIICGDGFKYMKRMHACKFGILQRRNQQANLEAISTEVKEVRESIGKFTTTDARPVNLSAARGQGHPAEIMDMIALQALSAKHVLENDLPVGVTKAPDEIDSLTDRQKARKNMDSFNFLHMKILFNVKNINIIIMILF